MSTNACADCGGFDIEWMYRCHTHKVDYCRGCDCPFCIEESVDDDSWPDDDGDSVSTSAGQP